MRDLCISEGEHEATWCETRGCRGKWEIKTGD